MKRSALLAVAALATVFTTRSSGQTAATNPFLRTLTSLSYDVETIADEVGLVCRRDLTSLPQTGQKLSKLKKLEYVLAELRRRYGARADFPSAEARRIGGRIESLEESLVRLQASGDLVQSSTNERDGRGQLFFEAVQVVCPGDSAKSVFDDVCKILGGTPSEECTSCWGGLLICCEKICTPG